MAVDTNQFRAVMGRFATGVTVVTTCKGTERHGITVNAFTSVSLDPPLVLICIDRTSHVHDILIESGVFAVNILAEEQQHLSDCFAGHSEYRFRDFCGATFHTATTGAPVLDGTLGYVDCRVVDVFPGGDHSIIVGRVETLDTGASDDPLLYYRSRYVHPGEQLATAGEPAEPAARAERVR
jgi:flavin reductase (DIM6/NTAB) family NADH-FMN oxidoreductase RutF